MTFFFVILLAIYFLVGGLFGGFLKEKYCVDPDWFDWIVASMVGMFWPITMLINWAMNREEREYRKLLEKENREFLEEFLEKTTKEKDSV